MPPANSPSDTRPTTPSPASDVDLAVGSRLGEISTSVVHREALDLSTLRLGEALSTRSAPPSGRYSEPVGRARGMSATSRGDDDAFAQAPTAELAFTVDGYLTPSEFQNPSQNLQLRGSRREQRVRIPDASSDADEGGVPRRHYTPRGPAPVRANLDADVTLGRSMLPARSAHSSYDSDEDLDGMSVVAPNTDFAARRDLQRLERALQTYRSARNALRANGTSDVGTVPTAGALRAYFNDDADGLEWTQRPVDLPLSAQARQRRQIRLSNYTRLSPDRGTRQSSESRLTTRKERKKAEAFDRVRNCIRYLSQLRHTGDEGGVKLATEFGLDSLFEFDESLAPSDLPMRIDTLPIPQHSAWLEPGMVWHGLQSTDREPIRSMATWTSGLRRERNREILRRTIARRRELGLDSFDAPWQLPAGTLLDAERYLSDLLQDANGRWSGSRPSDTFPTYLTPTAPQSTVHAVEHDHWPVKVTIHAVDYDKMTLAGTMSASHIPEQSLPHTPSTGGARSATTSMSSFFTGEIIDFRQQPLETESEGRDYRVGGLDVDARYWARLGPFRKEIQRVRSLRGSGARDDGQSGQWWNAFLKAVGDDGDDKELGTSIDHSTSATARAETMARQVANSGSDRPPRSSVPPESDDSKEAEDEEIMARCLGSAKWLKQNLGRDWILMRWKERCFVTPGGSESSSNSATRTVVTTPSSSATGTGPSGAANSAGGTSWGLTISGFYYIALNRLSGEIDGLYYDPGSQPYQALRMAPEGTAPWLAKDPDHGPGTEGPVKWTPNSKAYVCGCGDAGCKERVGLRKWFPAVEFR